MTKIIDGEVAVPIAADDPRFVRGVSETAANVTKRLYGPSGEQPHRVILANGAARHAVTVNATTGDEAAELALRKHPGLKVAYVGPVTNSLGGGEATMLTDDMAGE